MKRLIIALPVLAVLTFIPLAHAGAASLAAHKAKSDSTAPMAANVLTVASSISGTGLAGRYLFSRRQK